MAVVEGEKTTQILYKVQTGETSTGEPSYSTRTLSNINPAITAEDAFYRCRRGSYSNLFQRSYVCFHDSWYGPPEELYLFVFGRRGL